MQVRTPALGTVEETKMVPTLKGLNAILDAAIMKRTAAVKAYDASKTLEDWNAAQEASAAVMDAYDACAAYLTPPEPKRLIGELDLATLFAGSDETEAAHEWQDIQADAIPDLSADPSPWSPAEIAAKALEDMQDTADAEAFESGSWA